MNARKVRSEHLNHSAAVQHTWDVKKNTLLMAIAAVESRNTTDKYCVELLAVAVVLSEPAHDTGWHGLAAINQ